MKALILLLIPVFFLVSFSSHSQDIRDKNGIKTGKVEEDGDIRDKNGIKRGTV